jgi:DNA-binding NarL/FixJ family response regulator
MRVLISDPNRRFRDSLRRLLEAYGSEVVAETENGCDLEEQIAHHRPDVVVMTVARSENAEADAARHVLAALHHIKAVVLTTAAGERDTVPATNGELIRAFANGDGAVAGEALTRREQQVLDLMARGITSNRELARRLRVSQNTVKFHVRNILDKLHLHDRTQAVVYALRADALRDGSIEG